MTRKIVPDASFLYHDMKAKYMHRLSLSLALSLSLSIPPSLPLARTHSLSLSLSQLPLSVRALKGVCPRGCDALTKRYLVSVVWLAFSQRVLNRAPPSPT